ncbi:cholecystokinin [Lates calcarifer]|uniref:Cholecystokinin n=1 Tax=Lates calcarifer TaxID=8187 RepID=A0A4W6EDT5_LATCA|nr:cholecystokinin [Lates calcarifer]
MFAFSVASVASVSAPAAGSSPLSRPLLLPVCQYKTWCALSHILTHSLYTGGAKLNIFRLILSWSTPTTAVMNIGICVCVLLAALSSGSLSLPTQSMSQRAEGEALMSDILPPPSPNHTRQARSAPAPPSGQLANYNPQEDADARYSLSQLLARLISRKGSPYQTRSSLTSRASGLAPGHRIKDRDYLGWMDFGRRSAEEYEYSS